MNIDSGLDLNPNSFLSRWTAWRGRGLAKPIAAVVEKDAAPIAFVANRLLLAETESSLIRQFEKYGAEIVPEPPIPEPPPELRSIARRARPPRFLHLEFPRGLSDGLQEMGLRAIGEMAQRNGDLSVSGRGAAALLGLARNFANEGHAIGLDQFGESDALPLLTIRENPNAVGGSDPVGWTSFGGGAQIAHAWWLVESYRAIRSDVPLIWIAICDSGFWLDENGVPYVGNDGGSDFGVPPQWNFESHARPAGGPSGFKNGDTYGSPWHGNGSASVACAKVNNQLGAAGSGGTVARPMMFKLESGVASALLQSLAFSVAWGAKVANISVSYRRMIFPTLWEGRFAFAADNDVAIFCSAGNDGVELPQEDVRPATRTPGVLTVGALDQTDVAPRTDSNYGASVAIWAPGTNIPAAPNDGNRDGVTISGTSVASPIVAGVAAMMRAVNPALSPSLVFEYLVKTARPGQGHVKLPGRPIQMLDAYAAVLKAMGGVLPNITDNPTPAKAAPLVQESATRFVPFGRVATLSGSSTAYWVFRLETVSDVTVSLNWYAWLGTLDLRLECDDPDIAGLETVAITSGVRSAGAEGWSTLTAILGPGVYRLRIGGRGNVSGRDAATAYELIVERKGLALLPDHFEVNNTRDTATGLAFLGVGVSPHRLTLHRDLSVLTDKPDKVPIEVDWFVLDVPPSDGKRLAWIFISKTDELVDVALFDMAGTSIETRVNIRTAEIRPPAGTRVFLRVSASRQTRYSLAAMMMADPSAVPEPWRQFKEWPDWFNDPDPAWLNRDNRNFVLPADRDEWRREGLALHVPFGVAATLFDASDQVAAHAVSMPNGKLAFDTTGLGSGAYRLELHLPDSDNSVQVPAQAVVPKVITSLS